MTIKFSLSREVEEYPCDDRPRCRFVHRRLTNIEHYYLDGSEVSQSYFLETLRPLGFNLIIADNGLLNWGDPPIISEVRDG